MIERAHRILRWAAAYARAKRRRHGAASARQRLLIEAQRYEEKVGKRESGKVGRSSHRLTGPLSHSLALILAGGGLCLGVACTHTIRPRPVVAHAISFDGSEANSGFLGWAESVPERGSVTRSTSVPAAGHRPALRHVLGWITVRARGRYEALVQDYGKCWRPPLTEGYGIFPGPMTNEVETFFITREGLEKFLAMNRWRKEGKGKCE